MRYVVSVDVGIKNLGLAVFDLATCKFVFWNNVSLVPNGRYLPANNVQYVRDFVARHEWAFNDAIAVLVERQMRCNMRIIESVLQTMFFDKCIIINARSVKAHYNLGTKNYRMNKERAVQWVTDFVAQNPDAFATHAVQLPWEELHKKDDLADALLLIMYYLDTYSNGVVEAIDYFQTVPDYVSV
ncbi:MAG: hypothetical protein CMJ58_09165 [Planctomycetaceae bacterium]|jgi:hypothetical protein|nr:hypothetical protein [Planctomycetaceae bacterium]MAZ01232.1 hypothetical protein [Flavobacteriales bacterium]